MTPEQIHAQVLRLFTWAPDQETFGRFEYWSSFADDVEQGKPFTGDCDNFSLTCAELLARAGYDKEDIAIAFCQTETGGYHLVCLYGDKILDNRQRSVANATLVPYVWKSAMYLNEPGTWRELTRG